MPRLTSHGEVVYHQQSQGRLSHPFWGDYRQYWPHEAKPDMSNPSSCGSCGGGQAAPANNPPPTLDAWFTHAASKPSDFHEHVAFIRDIATGCESVTELSKWGKPFLIAAAAGKPKKLISVSPGKKAEWPGIAHVAKGHTEFVGVIGDSLTVEIEETDLLFCDTDHTADRVYGELTKHAPKVRKRIAIHTTTVYGETGDNGGPGVLPAIRRFVREHPEWTVWKRFNNNNGLMVLSRDPADKKQLPPMWKQAINFAKAKTRHMLNGGRYLPLPLAQERLAECLLCDQRTGERCGDCSCWLYRVGDEAPVNAGQPGKVFHPADSCPYGYWRERPNDGVEMTPDEVKAMLEEGAAQQ